MVEVRWDEERRGPKESVSRSGFEPGAGSGRTGKSGGGDPVTEPGGSSGAMSALAFLTPE